MINSSTAMRRAVSLAMCTVMLLVVAGPAAAQRSLLKSTSSGPYELKPTYNRAYGHQTWYQMPEGDPIGTVVFLHGCAHSASDFWPPTDACYQCLGLPMEIAHTKQALARGYAVLAISSADRDTKCFNWWSDNTDSASIINDFKQQWGLTWAPTYAVGVSSGGAFALKLPRMTKIDGVISEAIGITVGDWGMQDVQPAFPPTVFLKMPKDTKTAQRIDDDVAVLEYFNRPHAVITLLERAIYETYFSDMSPFITPEKSAQIFHGLKYIGMVGSDNKITQDPRYTKFPWQKKLEEVVPNLNNSDVASDSSQIYELMNVAFAWHEINGEYFTACLAWLESKGTANMDAMVQQYKITGPLAQLTADRYPAGGKPLQAGSTSVTKFSINSHDYSTTFGPGAASSSSSMYHVAAAGAEVAPGPSGIMQHGHMPHDAAMASAEAPAPAASLVQVSSVSAAWSNTGGSATWSLVVAVVAAFLLITT